MFGPDVRDLPTLVISVMFFAGVQLISLGVLGEYLGRMYEEVKGRPLVLGTEELGRDPPSAGAGGRLALGRHLTLALGAPAGAMPRLAANGRLPGRNALIARALL